MAYKRFLSFSLLALSLGGLAACQAAGAQRAADGQAAELAAELATVKAGAALYQIHCASCHGDNLQGGSAPSLADDNWEYGGVDADILSAINDGIEDAGMPGFKEVLAASDAQALLSYIRNGDTLQTTPPVSDVPSLTDKVRAETWLDNLESPWGIAFTGANQALITEKSGTLVSYDNGMRVDIANVPAVNDGGQGGLLDVALDPNWPHEDWVYLSFSHPKTPGSKDAMTKVIRAKIRGNALTDIQTVFEARAEDYVNTRFHFGSRITFDAAGHVYFSIGDRGKKDQAQDLTKPNGKIHRVNRDGSIPADNPFVDMDGAYASIYSYGNRNPQGLIVHPDTGVLWETEHGPKGGDELNIIRGGVNYGWPEISYGRNYNGTVLTPYTAKPGMAQPISQWTPSIAVCGLEVYTGDLFPDWKGRLLAGALAYQQLRLINVDGSAYKDQAIILKDKGRVRDVVTGPDGAIYVAVEDKILRLIPKE